MNGKRKDFEPIEGLEEGRTIVPVLECGEYGKDSNGEWWAKVPHAGMSQARLTDHQVIEHEDGTITVHPSILMETADGDQKFMWHGFLELGVWREC